MINKNVDKIKQINKNFKKSQIKDLNNIPGGDKDFAKGLRLFSSVIEPSKTILTEKELCFKYGIKMTDNHFTDIEKIMQKIEKTNNRIYQHADLSNKIRLLNNLADLTDILGYAIEKTGKPTYDIEEEDYHNLELFFADEMDINTAINRLYDFVNGTLDYLNKAVREQKIECLFVVHSILCLNIMQNIDIITSKYKKAEE